MGKYSFNSELRLSTVEKKLEGVFRLVLKRFDHTILVGHRNQEQQNNAVAMKTSTKSWPDSKHNASPSQAVDAAPYYPDATNSIDWRTDAAMMEAAKKGDWDEVKSILENIKRWHTFGGYVLGAGDGMGIPLRWGGDWNLNFKFNDQRLVDLPHFEVIP